MNITKSVYVSLLILVIYSYSGCICINAYSSEDVKPSLELPEYAAHLLAIDREFLSSVTRTTNNLHNGKYLLWYRFAGEDAVQIRAKLGLYPDHSFKEISIIPNEKNAESQKFESANRWQKKQSVYWRMKLPDSSVPFDFVGIIDDDKIWGRIYRINWDKDGWNPTTFNIGVFKITPITPEEEKELMKTEPNKEAIKTNTPNTDK